MAHKQSTWKENRWKNGYNTVRRGMALKVFYAYRFVSIIPSRDRGKYWYYCLPEGSQPGEFKTRQQAMRAAEKAADAVEKPKGG